MKISVHNLLTNTKFRFIIVGGLNTLIGYLVSIGIYNLFSKVLHISVIAIINAILAITISFVGHRYFVFKSVEPWLNEYIKMYLVNAIAMLVNIVLIWISVDIMQLEFWLAQGIITFSLTICMYFAHKAFTFKQKEK